MQSCSRSVHRHSGAISRSRAIAVAFVGLTLLTACGGTDARISVGVQSAPGVSSTAEIRYRILAGPRAWSVSFPIGQGGGPTPQRSKDFDTPKSGTAQVSFSIMLADGRDVANGAISLPLRDDWVWSVELQTRTVDPRQGCFGCIGSKSFPLPQELRTQGADSVWLVWGGNSIEHPVVY
jgi:hypothetical protein